MQTETAIVVIPSGAPLGAELVGVDVSQEAEALPLLQELSDFVTQSAFLYRHTWQTGDLLMWDNCCAQHLAIKDYELPQRRLMYRVTVNGSVPF